jgi:hypothetical protein
MNVGCLLLTEYQSECLFHFADCFNLYRVARKVKPFDVAFGQHYLFESQFLGLGYALFNAVDRTYLAR